MDIATDTATMITMKQQEQEQEHLADDEHEHEHERPNCIHHLQQRRSFASWSDFILQWGGPGTRMPVFVESALTWMLAVSCLSVSGYYYIVANCFHSSNCHDHRIIHEGWINVAWDLCLYLCDYDRIMWLVRPFSLSSPSFATETRQALSNQENNNSNNKTSMRTEPVAVETMKSFSCWIPLTTASRNEYDAETALVRFQQLERILQLDYNQSLISINNSRTYPNSSNRLDGATSRQAAESCPSSSSSSSSTAIAWSHHHSNWMIQHMRQDILLRRLATLAMRPTQTTSSSRNNNNSNSNPMHATPLGQVLVSIWPQLLQLPDLPSMPTTRNDVSSSTTTTSDHNKKFAISLIVPCHGELGQHVQIKLNHALNHCVDPGRVQVILIDAGGCHDLALYCCPLSTSNNKNKNKSQQTVSLPSSSSSSSSSSSTATTTTTTTTDAVGMPYNNMKAVDLSLPCIVQPQQQDEKQLHHAWGEIQVITYTEQGGRGPCLNFGAAHATGTLFAFLHSDTRLPQHWDDRMSTVFYYDHNDHDEHDDDIDQKQQQQQQQQDSNQNDQRQPKEQVSHSHRRRRRRQCRPNACAFGFGIDTSTVGLNGGHYPPGLRAVEATANLRCTWWSLPYGDQCLCLPAVYFHYLGGFPHQCLFEDYELIALLRKRSTLLPYFDIQTTKAGTTSKTAATTTTLSEALVIVPGSPALCSPRRWQQYGCLYVTYLNSKLVNLYVTGGWTPDQLYEQYYGKKVHTAHTTSNVNPVEEESPTTPPIHSSSATRCESQQQLSVLSVFDQALQERLVLIDANHKKEDR